MAVGVRGGRSASFADLFASPTSERGDGGEDDSGGGVRGFASAAESERMMMKRLSFVQSSPSSSSQSPAAVRPQSSSAAPHASVDHARNGAGGVLDEKEELMVGSVDDEEEDNRGDEYNGGDTKFVTEAMDDTRVGADYVEDSSGMMIPAFHDSQGQFMARARLAATILDEEGIVQAADRSEHEARMALGADTSTSGTIVEPSPAPTAPGTAHTFPTPGLMAPRYMPTTARADASRGPGGYQDNFLTPLVPSTNGGRKKGVTMAMKRAREEDGAATQPYGAMYGERHLAEFPVRDASARRARLDRREEDLQADGQEGGMSKVIASALGFGPGTEAEGSHLASGSMSRLSEAWQVSKSGRTSLRTIAGACTTAVTYAWQRWYEVTLARRNPKDHHYYSSAMVRARLRLVGRYGYERYRAERLRLSCWRMATLLSRARRSAATTLARKRLRTQARLILREWYAVVGGRREEEVASGRRASRVLRASVRAWRAAVVGLQRRETLAECHRAGLERRQCLRCIASWRRQVVTVRGARQLAALAADWRQTERLGRAMREWKRVALSRAAGLKRLFIARRLEQLVLARLSMRAWLSLVHASHAWQSTTTDADAQFRDEYYISSRAQRLIDDLKAELARAQGRMQSLRHAEDDALNIVFQSSPTPTPTPTPGASDTAATTRLEAEVVRLQRELETQQDSSARIAKEVEALHVDVEGERARTSRLQEALEIERQRSTSRGDELTKALAVVDELTSERLELRQRMSEYVTSAADASVAGAEARAEAEVGELRARVATLTGELTRVQSESKDVVKEQMITETSLIEAEEDLKHVVEAKVALESALEVSNARVLEETRRAESLEEALRQAEADHAVFEDEILRLHMEEEERVQSAAAAAPVEGEGEDNEEEITIDEYNAALDEAELREIELTEDKDALVRRCSEMAHELDFARAQIMELQSASTRLDASREAVETKCAQAEGELSIALIQLETTQKQNDELQAEIASTRSALDVQRRDTIGLHEELGEAQDQIVALREDKIALEEGDLEASRAEREALQARLIEEKKAREADAETFRVEKNRIHAAAAENAAAAASRASTLTEELKSARDELDSVRGAIQAMEIAVRGTKRVDEREDVYTKLSFVRERCIKLTRELDDVRTSEAEVTRSLHIERRISESSQDDMVTLRAKQEKLQELLDVTEGKVRGLEQELTMHREAEAAQLKKIESNAAAIRQHRDALLAEVRELKQNLLLQQQQQQQQQEQQKEPQQQEQRALVSHASTAATEAPPPKTKATTPPLSVPAAPAPASAVSSPHRRGSFRKASLDRWRSGFSESKSPSGSVDSSSSAAGAGTRKRSTSSSSTKAGTTMTTPVEGGILDQRLDAEDLIAMQAESKATTTPTTTPTPEKSRRKLGAFKLATHR